MTLPPKKAPVWRDPLLFMVGFIVSFVTLIGQLLALMIVTGGAVIAVPVLVVMLIAGYVVDRFAIRKSNPLAGWPFTAFMLGFAALVLVMSVLSGGGPP